MSGEDRYFNEEELEALIAEVEGQELLKAPAYLKQEILAKAGAAGEKAQKARPARKSSARLQLLLYSAKVVAGAAAAVLLLLVMPVAFNQSAALTDYSEREQRIEEDMQKYRELQSRKTQEEENGGVVKFMSDKTNEISKKLNDFSNLFFMEERNYD